MEEIIEGYVDHIIYRNQDNGYTVACLVVQWRGADLCRDLSVFK